MRRGLAVAALLAAAGTAVASCGGGGDGQHVTTKDKVTIMCDDLNNMMSANSTETASQGLAIVESDLDAIGGTSAQYAQQLENDSSLQIPADLNYLVGVCKNQGLWS